MIGHERVVVEKCKELNKKIVLEGNSWKQLAGNSWS